MNTISTVLSIVLSTIAVGATFVSVIKWVLKQNSQDKEIEEIKGMLSEEICEIKKEMRLLTKGTLACLDGLEQQGCNHTVPSTKQEISEFLLEEAHK